MNDMLDYVRNNSFSSKVTEENSDDVLFRANTNAQLSFDCSIHRSISSFRCGNALLSKCFLRFSPKGIISHIVRFENPLERDQLIKQSNIFYYSVNIENRIEEIHEIINSGIPLTTIGHIQPDTPGKIILCILNQVWLYIQQLTNKYLINEMLLACNCEPKDSALFFCYNTATITSSGKLVFLFQNYLKHVEVVELREKKLFLQQHLFIFDFLLAFLFNSRPQDLAEMKRKRSRLGSKQSEHRNSYNCMAATGPKKNACKLRNLLPKFYNLDYTALHEIFCVEAPKYRKGDIKKLNTLNCLFGEPVVKSLISQLSTLSAK